MMRKKSKIININEVKMGEKLASYFEKAKEKSGLSGQVKLAMMTKLSLDKAKLEPDSFENIKIFEEAIAKI